MRVFQANDYNVGDQLPTPLIEHFLNVPVEVAGKKVGHKLMVIGSEFHQARRGDVIWGQGVRRTWVKTFTPAAGIKVLAVRGRLTRKYITGVDIPEVYGDPGLLMPLVYLPKVDKTHKVGIVPHHSERGCTLPEGHIINVTLPWKKFIQELLSCEEIISSSLHGIVLAEAYGIPATWALWGNTVKFRIKYEDYLTGTDREVQEPGKLPPIIKLKDIQGRLLIALLEYYGTRIR